MNRGLLAAVLSSVAFSSSFAVEVRVAPVRLPGSGSPSVGAVSRIGSLRSPTFSPGGLSAAPGFAPGLAPSLTPLAAASLAPSLESGVVEAAMRAPAPGSDGPQVEGSLGNLGSISADFVQPSASGGDQGKRWDGAKARKDAVSADTDGSAEPETVTSEIAPNPAEVLEMRFSRDAKKALKASALSASVRLIGGKGSQWYWERFKRGTDVRVLVGGQTFFVSKVEAGKTLTIGELLKKDFEGVYSPQVLKGKGAVELRKKLMEDLAAYNRYSKPGMPAIIGLRSKVRLVKFMTYGAAKALPGNHEVPLPVVPRAQLPIPAALANAKNFLPKIVMLDMRLFPDKVGGEFLEDMGKLMKAGVYFVLMSDKPSQGPGSLEEQLTKGLTNRQRDGVTRYKMITVTGGGTQISEYKGSFASPLPAQRFSKDKLDIMEHAARAVGGTVVASKGYELGISGPAGVAPAELAARYAAALERYGIPAGQYFASSEERVGKPVVTLRPTSLVGSLPQLYKGMQDNQGLYVLPSDMMVITRDPELLKATAGSVQPSRLSELQGGELVDMSMAALLGGYRENMPADFAASASKISSFQKYKDSLGGDFYNVYMLMGHVMHSAFNWAVWKYRTEGKFPSADELVARGEANWRHEEASRTKKMIDKPGETLAGYHEVMVSRLRTMHTVTADILKQYPIVIGTELPNLFVINRYDKTKTMSHRDILRLVFDFAVARETPEGLEVMVVDFKTGQTPSIQTLGKDTQYQLYDLGSRALWKEMGVPYGLAGEQKKVVRYGVRFIFPVEAYEPELTEQSRIVFEKFIKNTMGRMRKAMAPPLPPSSKSEAKALKGKNGKGKSPKGKGSVSKAKPKTGKNYKKA